MVFRPPDQTELYHTPLLSKICGLGYKKFCGAIPVNRTERPKDRQADRLDPVGSTVRYEMMKLCTGSV